MKVKVEHDAERNKILLFIERCKTCCRPEPRHESFAVSSLLNRAGISASASVIAPSDDVSTSEILTSKNSKATLIGD